MIDWPNVIAGFLFGLTPVAAAYGYRVVLWLRSPVRAKYRGRFWLYHWSLVDPSLVREKMLEIKFSVLRGRPIVILPADPMTRLDYTGRILRGQGSVIYLLLRGRAHKENILFVFNDPLYPVFHATTGVFASVDVKTRPVAARALLAPERLDEEAAKSILKSRKVVRAEPTLLS